MQILTAVAVTFLIGLATFAAYHHAAKSMAKKHRPRIFMFAMTIPLVMLILLITPNPLPALPTLIHLLWPRGPSG